jgi:hypothetical protein
MLYLVIRVNSCDGFQNNYRLDSVLAGNLVRMVHGHSQYETLGPSNPFAEETEGGDDEGNLSKRFHNSVFPSIFHCVAAEKMEHSRLNSAKAPSTTEGSPADTSSNLP